MCRVPRVEGVLQLGDVLQSPQTSPPSLQLPAQARVQPGQLTQTVPRVVILKFEIV